MSLNERTDVQIETREQFQQEKKEVKKQKREKEKIRIRLIPIWLRLLIISVLAVIMLMLGAIVGYSVLGDGKAGDVFKKSTWTHITDIVLKEK